MDLNKALETVANIYAEYPDMGFEVIQYRIFEILQKQSNTIDINDAESILFFEKGKICYRSVFDVGTYYVTNKHGFHERIADVIPFNRNPFKLKAIIAEFVKRLQNGTFEQKSYWDEEYPTGKPVNDLKEAHKIANKIIKGNKMKEVFNKMLEVNKASAVHTAKVELGKSANKLVLAKVTPQLPRYVRGYADSPLAELVIANVVAGLLMQFAPDNDKAKILSEAMIAAGAQVAIESFDIPGIINELLANVDVSGIVADED